MDVPGHRRLPVPHFGRRLFHRRARNHDERATPWNLTPLETRYSLRQRLTGGNARRDSRAFAENLQILQRLVLHPSGSLPPVVSFFRGISLADYYGGADYMAEQTKEELLARIAELEKQAGGRRKGSLEFRVGEKGGVSVYGLGRFPVTLYYEQWVRLLDASTELRGFLEENKSRLKLKDKTE